MEGFKKFDAASFTTPRSVGIRRGKATEGFNIVNCPFGMRIVLAKEMVGKCEIIDTCEISFDENRIAIGRRNIPNGQTFYPRPWGKKLAIYSAGLVKEVTEKYDLDFSGKTSLTFHDIDYEINEVDDSIIAIVTINKIS